MLAGLRNKGGQKPAQQLRPVEGADQNAGLGHASRINACFAAGRKRDPADSPASMGQQDRNGAAMEDVAGHPAKDEFAPARAAIGALDDEARAGPGGVLLDEASGAAAAGRPRCLGR